jgi:hypothetical protein
VIGEEVISEAGTREALPASPASLALRAGLREALRAWQLASSLLSVVAGVSPADPELLQPARLPLQFGPAHYALAFWNVAVLHRF